MRVARAGNLFTASESADGSAWIAIGGATTIDLPDQAHVGLCVTSHRDGVLSTAVFEQVTISPSGGG